VGSLVMAILTELQAFDFSNSFYGEFTVANAVGDLLFDSLGIDRCCGRSTTLEANHVGSLSDNTNSDTGGDIGKTIN
ncbi:MAG: hypothetical protein WBG32_17800, partial [Nodosilinea sp.]